jgi:FtsP/CotA-like multicopper oxidase with cupredoxin domain
VLLAGALLLAGGSYGVLRGGSATPVSAEPVSFSSGQGRVVKYTLTADEQVFQIGTKRVLGKGYNGRYVGPTLVLRPGDTLDLQLVNRLSEPTNLHFHGMHVSPTGLSDNVFRMVEPGQTARYVVKLPPDVDPGLYWYHSHNHPLSSEQVFGGLSGLIVVEGMLGLLPANLRGIPDKTFALKDFQDHDGAIPSKDADIHIGAPTNRTVNGELDPRINIRPGETQLWRFANIGANIFYDLALDGHTFHVVAQDANPVWKVWATDHLLMPPGSRFEVLVQGAKAGTYTLRTRAYGTGPAGNQFPEATLATVVSSGRAQPPAVLPTSLVPKTVPWGYLADQPIARRRTATFSENAAGTRFFIDGRPFDMHRVDVRPLLGTTEEWTVRNTSGEQHPFHIHQDDFQVMSVNGVPYDANGQQDTVNLPAHGEVVIRDSFTQFTGEFVFHCHILNHEDNGMMATVDVVARAGAGAAEGGPVITGVAH